MDDHAKLHPSLTRSFKGVYPFKISTTSFIYPDHYVPNVKMLGRFVDEIELLLFESASVETLLSPSVLEELLQLSKELNLTYNIHLPTDVSLSDCDAVRQQQAVDQLIRAVERVAPLSPSTHTLHIPYQDDPFDPSAVTIWQDRVFKNLEKILAAGIAPDRIALETLDYPFEIAQNIVTDLNLTVCLDIGHLILHGHDIQSVFNQFSDRISIIHLHGVDNHQDHLPLGRLPAVFINPVMRILKRYWGIVSLEVFSLEYLDASFKFLERCWNDEIVGSG